jgi:thiosulfate dehydrogenase [quinone] large subunit
MLLPLRLFLGVTFTYAALQKFSDPSFFGSSSPTSVQAQMRALAPSSPIGPLIDLTLHAGPLVGILIASAELVVGLAALAGLKMRWAAALGAILALTFYLSVSWNTRPYYYGADIVFLFAWTPFLGIGSGDVLSVDGYLRAKSEARSASPGRTTDASGMERRAVVALAGAAALVATTGAALGSINRSTDDTSASTLSRRRGATLAGRASSHEPRHKAAQNGAGVATQPAPSGPPTPPAGMTEVARLADLRTGSARSFRDPRSGQAAWLIRSRTTVLAFSAVCTHAGCLVSYDQSASEFVCPCHGGTYSGSTGAVLGGPPPSALPRIDVTVADGRVYVR